jgi:hypothetical protein
MIKHNYRFYFTKNVEYSCYQIVDINFRAAGSLNKIYLQKWSFSLKCLNDLIFLHLNM